MAPHQVCLDDRSHPCIIIKFTSMIAHTDASSGMHLLQFSQITGRCAHPSAAKMAPVEVCLAQEHA
eukprot:365673-Chlamydomonas_euryale.AAC.10